MSNPQSEHPLATKMEASLRRLVDRSSATKERVSWCFTSLSILDSKGSALLTVNSIFLALSTALLLRTSTHGWQSIVSGSASLALAISVAACMRVAQMKWHFLASIDADEAKGDGIVDKEVVSLCGVIRDRTDWYIAAWRCTLWGMGLAAVAIVAAALQP